MIIGAKITAVEKNTGFTRSTATSGGGHVHPDRFVCRSYIVSVESTGFKGGNSEVGLDVNQAREVNFKLAAAQTEIKVELSAAPALIDTTDSTLGGLVTGQQVVTLPLNGRDITSASPDQLTSEERGRSRVRRSRT